MDRVDMREFHEKLRNIPSFYMTLGYNGYYLPAENSKCISGEYLWNVLNENVFTLKRIDKKQGFPVKKLKKEELLELFEQVLVQKQKKPSGIKPSQLPDKEWLVNCIYTVDPDNSLFKVEQQPSIIQRNVLSGQFQNLDFAMVRGEVRSFLRLTNKEKLQIKTIKKEKKIAQKKKVLKKLSDSVTQKQQEIALEEQKLLQLKNELAIQEGRMLNENQQQNQNNNQGQPARQPPPQ